MAMATAPSNIDPIRGRLDAEGRLIAADPQLEALHGEAGGTLGTRLAVPQLAALAKLAASLGTPVSRPVTAGTNRCDLHLTVRAIPTSDGVDLVIDSWDERPPAGPRLAGFVVGQTVAEQKASWSVNERLEIVSASQTFAEHLRKMPEDLIGQPLTKVVRLDENENGELPLLAALAERVGFSGQPAWTRDEPESRLLLSAEVVIGPSGEFRGLSGIAEREEAPETEAEERPTFDHVLDQALRSPLDRIIKEAEQIVQQPEGPLREDYAAYGQDIASAARHLLSVISSMSEEARDADGVANLAELGEEAVVMLESAAAERGIAVQLQARRRLPCRGDRHAIIQILVNLIGNAIRHSPAGGHVDLYFTRGDGQVCVAVEDQGPGIAAGDEERIFERFERASDDASGTGLGLAIARRLARSMGGDVTLDQKTGRGARFTLALPEA
jgi:signal transduction histidine kinase